MQKKIKYMARQCKAKGCPEIFVLRSRVREGKYLISFWLLASAAECFRLDKGYKIESLQIIIRWLLEPL